MPYYQIQVSHITDAPDRHRAAICPLIESTIIGEMLMALYEPPDPSEWDFLTGATLLQICVGQYQLILKFHEHISISVECGMTVTRSDGNGDQVWKPDTPFTASDMFALIGRDVTDYQILEDASLRLVFAQSGQITINAENSGYESYNINYFDGSNNLWVI